jgi:D-glycero-alpha-D-manno-heptose-7-phosphate kinase
MKKDVRDLMQSRMLLFWLGTTRHADRILKEQAKGLSDGSTDATGIYDGATHLFGDLKDNDISRVGLFLRENWHFKKQLALGISNKEVDNYYDKALEAGAIGGKLCGAGGSGFLLFYAEHKYHLDIENALGLRRVPFQICDEGSQVIYEDGGRNV